MWLALWFDVTDLWSFGYAVNQHQRDHEQFCQKHEDKRMYISYHPNVEDAVERAERVIKTHVMNVRFKQEYGTYP
jgi:hypothetical protein